MSTEVTASSTVRPALPPWRSVLAVVAHPDDESFALGAVIDAFIAQGTTVAVFCMTEGETATLGSGINLGKMRRDELAAASGDLGVAGTVLHHHPDGALRTVCRHILAGEVIDEAGAVRAEGLLVFDDSGVTGHPDHTAATSAALLAADVLGLPVLAWTLPAAVAQRLNEELGTATFRGRLPSEIDLRISVDRTRQVTASREHRTQAIPASPLWRRLELLGDEESLRWLRHPDGAGAAT